MPSIATMFNNRFTVDSLSHSYACFKYLGGLCSFVQKTKVTINAKHVVFVVFCVNEH